MKAKIEFIEQPPQGVCGDWKTADGFKCYTDNRTTAVRWYKNWLNKQNENRT